MNIDFPALLVLATLATGLIWALDAVLWAPKRKQQAAALATNGGSVDSGQI